MPPSTWTPIRSPQIADLVPSLPGDAVFDLLNALDQKDRAEVQSVLSFPGGSVGSLMDLHVISVCEDVELEVVLRYLRKRQDLPEQIDELVVVDRAGALRGVLPVKRLLVHEPGTHVADVMVRDPIAFRTDESACDAVQFFERYDLRSAPVVNLHGQVVGVLGIDEVTPGSARLSGGVAGGLRGRSLGRVRDRRTRACHNMANTCLLNGILPDDAG